jgi:hypothetical protein
MHTGLWWGNLMKGDHLEVPGIDNIKMDLREVGWGMNWIELTENTDRWQEMNLWVP